MHLQAATNEDWPDGHFDDAHTKEVLRFERELLQLEQEELRRQRENLLRDKNRMIQKSVQDISTVAPEKPIIYRANKTNGNYRHSMPNLLVENYVPVVDKTIPEVNIEEEIKRKPFVSEEHIQSHFGVEESRKVLYDEAKIVQVRQAVPNMMKAPQPVLPPKPKSRDSIEREITMRSSRVPSAVEYVNIDRNAVQMRQKAVNGNVNYHPMTRHTLQALSAAPTPKLISNTEWMQTRNQRKPAGYNYNQHWLIQEAEQRRIQEQRARTRVAPPASTYPAHHMQVTHPHTQTQTQTYPQNQTQIHSQTLQHQLLTPTNPIAQERRARTEREDKMLSVSGRRKCSHCGEELGRGAAMIIEPLSLCYHVRCFACAVCGAALGDGRAGADVRVRARRLHCHHCYSADDGSKYSCV